MPRRRKVRVPRAAAPDSGWAFRFLARLASFGWDEALVDGREAALGGAVVSFEVAKSGARSEFRRADGHHEEARLSLRPLPPAALRKALSSMAARARFAADLLAGRIPDDVEAAFAGTGRTLLPATADELVALCTCDAPLPCVHAGAAAVLLGDALADDPFLVFLLRGLPREELLAGLQRARRRPAPSGAARPDDEPDGPRRPEEPPEPLPPAVLERPELFYRPAEPAAALRTVFAPPEHPEAVLTRLGPPPLHDPEASRLLLELHRAIGLGARERLADWEWRRAGGRG
ncbi:MAG TPA: hypothetical protein VGM13_09525 [Thermoanaerobaculia bacterium]|jgi:uncharacterized Zn finger protein